MTRESPPLTIDAADAFDAERVGECRPAGREPASSQAVPLDADQAGEFTEVRCWREEQHDDEDVDGVDVANDGNQ